MSPGSVVGYIVVICILSGLVYAVYLEIQRGRIKRRRFTDRDRLSLDEIFSRFFDAEGLNKADVLKHWKTVADILSFDPGLLRPTDRFNHELGPIPGDEMDDDIDFLWYHFYDLAEKASIDLNACHVQTLGELIILLSSKE